MNAQPLIEGITQWIDSSFVTDTQNPHDIDVVSFCDTDYYNAANETTQTEINRLLEGQRSTKESYSTHSILVLCAPPGHPDRATSELWRKYYRE